MASICPFPKWNEGKYEPKVEAWEEKPLPAGGSRYLRPYRAHYTLDGKELNWDLFTGLDSVAVLVYVIEWGGFVLVRQFRAAVYRRARVAQSGEGKVPGIEGLTIEAVAGLCDKSGHTLEEMAAAELWEEAGVRVSPESLELVTKTLLNIGMAAAQQTCFFVQVHASDFAYGAGGGLEEEGEVIEQVFLPENEIELFLNHPVGRPPSLQVMLRWFQLKKQSTGSLLPISEIPSSTSSKHAESEKEERGIHSSGIMVVALASLFVVSSLWLQQNRTPTTKS